MYESWHIWVMSHMYESWHMWISHGTHKGVIASKLPVPKKSSIWMSHGTHKWVTTQLNESWHTWISHGTLEWVMAPILPLPKRSSRKAIERRLRNSCNAMQHTLQHALQYTETHCNSQCNTLKQTATHRTCIAFAEGKQLICKSVMARMNKPCVSHMDESWHTQMSHDTHKWVLALVNESWHTWMSHGIYIAFAKGKQKRHPPILFMCSGSSTPIHTYKWITSHRNESCHIWMSHGTYISFAKGKQQRHPPIPVRARLIALSLKVSHVTHTWIMSHICEWVTSFISLWPFLIWGGYD